MTHVSLNRTPKNAMDRHKKTPLLRGFFNVMAESEGFEPPEDFSSTVFKTAAFDHSASSPES